MYTNFASPYWALQICAKYLDKIWSLGKCKDVKLGEVSSLFISYNIIISWLYPLNGFRIIFLLHNSAGEELVILYGNTMYSYRNTEINCCCRCFFYITAGWECHFRIWNSNRLDGKWSLFALLVMFRYVLHVHVQLLHPWKDCLKISLKVCCYSCISPNISFRGLEDIPP